MGPVPRQLKVGDTFAGYRIDALAGRGGMGVVFRATDLALERQVALKLIAPDAALDPVFRARFEHECRAAAAIDHPHAVEVFHAGEEDGVLYVTMRYVEGTDLGALLARESALDPDRAVGLVAQVAGALDDAHRRGLVHRDVKPTNVLIALRNGDEHAFLTDFGLTKRPESDSGLTKPGFAMGTADYMAPEQARGADIDGRADVYALGCVLYKSLTGVVPFDRGSDLEKMMGAPQRRAAVAARRPPGAAARARRRGAARDGEGPRRALRLRERVRPGRAGGCRRRRRRRGAAGPPRRARCAWSSPRTPCCCARASSTCSRRRGSTSSARPATPRS